MYAKFDIELTSDNMLVEIIINKKGAYLNGELKLSDVIEIERLNNYFKTTPISIGSDEGAYKGVAKYNLVCLRKYRERRI